MLDTIQKKSNAEKTSVENNMKLSLNNLEQKYQKQIKDIQESHRRIYTELINNNKELDKEIKSLRTENSTKKVKVDNNLEITKKLEELNQEREKYRKLEDTLKSEKEKQITELNNKFAKEKETLKKKIADIEKNLREAEGKRGVLLLELEREKAKWDIEKDNYITKNQEFEDKVAKLEKKNENLLRENEKLKNEKNMMRARGYNKNPDFKFGTHLSSTVGSRKYDYTSSYNSAMLKALDKNSDENKEIEKDKEKDTNEKKTKTTVVTSSGNTNNNKNTNAKTTITTTTTTTTSTSKSINDKKDGAKKK